MTKTSGSSPNHDGSLQETAIKADHLQSVLAEVRDGSLSPQDAAAALLATAEPDEATDRVSCHQMPDAYAESCHSPSETVASLLGRLGTPPADVVEGWCQQLVVASAIHQQEVGAPLTEIHIDEWRVAESGQLMWNNFTFHCETEDLTPLVDSVSMDCINSFREYLQPDQPVSKEPIADPSVSGTTQVLNRTEKVIPQTERSNSKFRQYLLYTGAAVGVVAIAGILYFAAKRNSKQVAAEVGQPSSPPPTSVARGTAPLGINTDPVDSDELTTELNREASHSGGSNELTTFDSPDVESHSQIDVVGVELSDLSAEMMLGDLDTIAASSSQTRPSEKDSTVDPTQAPENENSNEPPKLASDPMGDASSPDPAETPQETRSLRSGAITLPNQAESVALPGLTGNDLKLDFPHSVGLEIENGESIRDVRSKKPVAELLTSSDPPDVSLRWAQDSSKVSSRGSLLHGRISDADGNSVFLRPVVEASAWPIDLAATDIRPTWDLLGPLPPRVARLSIDFELPSDLEENWIEALGPSSFRRGTAIAVLHSKEIESVWIGMRIDVRCSRKLSLRIRYAAKLHEQAAWQAISRPALIQWLDRLADQRTMVGNQLIQIENVYSNADSDGRRRLRSRREQLEDHAKQLGETIDQADKLNRLVEKVRTQCKLNVKLWVQWPDGTEQDLLLVRSAKPAK